MIIANVATYPGRYGNRRRSIQSIATQVDVLNICLNEYSEVPDDLRDISNANYYFPENNLKDVGKFAFEVSENDDVFLCDDDIIYPQNYVSAMLKYSLSFKDQPTILGVHGVIYSDYYDGRKRSGRLVHVFDKALDEGAYMNQLGTGTVFLKGRELPSYEEMRSSAGFVDIRLAKISFEKNINLYCIPREAEWLKEIQNDSSIYLTVTSNLPIDALKEVQSFGGLAKLPNLLE
ncbi:MAG: hypothetical protein HWE26_19545 [Alteromonadaceae bacterium]|nr:hypothetical protein [Alteromonadaceae bacterium]